MFLLSIRTERGFWCSLCRIRRYIRIRYVRLLFIEGQGYVDSGEIRLGKVGICPFNSFSRLLAFIGKQGNVLITVGTRGVLRTARRAETVVGEGVNCYSNVNTIVTLGGRNRGSIIGVPKYRL